MDGCWVLSRVYFSVVPHKDPGGCAPLWSPFYERKKPRRTSGNLPRSHSLQGTDLTVKCRTSRFWIHDAHHCAVSLLAEWAARDRAVCWRFVGTSNCLLELLGENIYPTLKIALFIYFLFFPFSPPHPPFFHGCMLATVHTCGGQRKTFALWVIGSKFRQSDMAARVSTHWAPIAPALEPIFIPVF